MSTAADELLRREVSKGRLTARGLHRIRRVARTLADLDDQPDAIDEQFVILALAMRTRVGLSAVGRVA